LTIIAWQASPTSPDIPPAAFGLQEKISVNFSNFSAWHYRSTLLPLVHPDATTYNGIDAEVTAQGAAAAPGVAFTLAYLVACGQEFDLVTQALFIDAADQSAWLYHRWLLGRGA
jgi:geranylgeranyl transferase type-2 subunit alpha